MLINKDPQKTAQVSISYKGYTPAAGSVRTVSYTKGGTALTTATRGTSAAQTLPPYSITTLQLRPASAASLAEAPSPAPSPTAAAKVTPASGTIGTRAQASAAGVPVGRPDRSDTAGDLASTGRGSTVTYSALGGLLAVAAGSLLVLRRRRGRGSHAR